MDIEKFEKHLGKKQFFSTKDLISLGLFGSRHGIYLSIKYDQLPFFYVSPGRMVIMREDLLKYVSQQYDSS